MKAASLMAFAALGLSLALAQGCASDESLRKEFVYDGRIWNPDAIPAGFAAAGLSAKSTDGTYFESKGVKAQSSVESNGKVKVVLEAEDAEAARHFGAISNGIGRALVPKDKLRRKLR